MEYFALLQELKKLNESISRIAHALTPADPTEHLQRIEKRLEQIGNAFKGQAPEKPTTPKKLYSVSEAAEETRISAYTLREAIREGRISAVAWGREYRLAAEVVEGIKAMGLPPKRKAG